MVPERLFMCLMHWGLVPYALRYQITTLYKAGKNQSSEYLAAARSAIDVVASKELKRDPPLPVPSAPPSG